MTAHPILTFAHAQLDAAEAVARPPDGVTMVSGTYFEVPLVGDYGHHVCDEWSSPYLAVDPAAALRSIEADRKVLALHDEQDGMCTVCALKVSWDQGEDFPCPTILALVSKWAGADGWDEAWA